MGTTLRQIAKQVASRTIPDVARLIRERDSLLEQVSHLERELERLGANQAAAASRTSILDAYVTEPPSPETPFRVFAGEWSSCVPRFGLGTAELFNDPRVEWIGERAGGFAGKRILELGPLEGGHTYMMATRGAAQITAIESNSRAYLKCLIVRDALGFDAHFMLGDFRPYLKTCDASYDLVLASGVLYHMTDPVGLLADMARVSRAIGLWTHYYDAGVVNSRDDLRRKFSDQAEVSQLGTRTFTRYRQSYLEALNWSGFCGGTEPISYWLTKESLLGCLDEFGFSVDVGREYPDHPNGPAILLYASRRSV